MKRINEIYIIGDNEELFSSVVSQLGQEFNIQKLDIEEIKKFSVQIVLMLRTEKNSPLDVAQTILSHYPGAFVIYVSDIQNFELLRDLNRVGVMEYLILPEEEWLLEDRIREITESKLFNSDSIPTDGFKRGSGKVFTFYSGKGGAGKSLLSTAFAQTLKIESTAKVLFIDLNLQYGGAETFLGIDSNRSLIDLFPVIQELNEYHIRNVAEKEPHSGLEVLVSPRDAAIAERIDEDFVLRLIRASRRSYDFIIIDVPTWMDERVYTAIEESEKIYYVMSYDTVAIRVLKSVEDLLQQLGLVTKEKVELLINFSGKDNELNQKDIERFISYPVAAKVRRDLKGVQSFVNQGLPLRKELKDKKLPIIAKDVQKWVKSMLK
ncbi:AAA family ATPase [Ornithinibacillus sp. FSL M8-0202]|uniref:AAA family ATPase n=1 Tax=unclassified Ornithinibacillus TaxID=2620869 RepID=UPI0030CB96FF